MDVPPITTIGKRLAEEFRHFLGIAQNVTATLDVHVVKYDAASQKNGLIRRRFDKRPSGEGSHWSLAATHSQRCFQTSRSIGG
ncbi:MAG: hypothetical protein WB509_24755 [Acetobacteraceae bacterium]